MHALLIFEKLLTLFGMKAFFENCLKTKLMVISTTLLKVYIQTLNAPIKRKQN
jgi:hypothetical protein